MESIITAILRALTPETKQIFVTVKDSAVEISTEDTVIVVKDKRALDTKIPGAQAPTSPTSQSSDKSASEALPPTSQPATIHKSNIHSKDTIRVVRLDGMCDHNGNPLFRELEHNIVVRNTKYGVVEAVGKLKSSDSSVINSLTPEDEELAKELGLMLKNELALTIKNY